MDGEVLGTCNHCFRELNEQEFATSRRCKLCRYLARYKVLYREYEAMRDSQGGKCAICQHVPTGVYPDILCIDHDHIWKNRIEVRGLLCQGCNRGIGSFADNPVALFRAIQYVERRGEHYGASISRTRFRRKDTPDWRQKGEEKADLAPRYQELAERFGKERFVSSQWAIHLMVILIEGMWDAGKEPDGPFLKDIYTELQKYFQDQ